MTKSELENGCVLCGPGPGYTAHKVDEGMFATGESFTYRECHGCGSLQITDVPEDLGSYYDADSYYSFAATHARLHQRWLRTPPVRLALRLNTELYLRTGRGRGQPWMREAGLEPNDRILDLGCGNGHTLASMHLLGFKHLTGADPFLDQDKEVTQGVPLLKRSHADIQGSFDWVMMHHAFEHVVDPRATLRSLHRLLDDDGRALIRIPVMGKFAWRKYGVHWAQIDPPRHLVVYTEDAITQLAAEEGFEVERVFYDSSAFQFWASEMVCDGKPHSAGSGHFSVKRLAQMSADAERLNAARDGDSLGIVLRPA